MAKTDGTSRGWGVYSQGERVLHVSHLKVGRRYLAFSPATSTNTVIEVVPDPAPYHPDAGRMAYVCDVDLSVPGGEVKYPCRVVHQHQLLYVAQIWEVST